MLDAEGERHARKLAATMGNGALMLGGLVVVGHVTGSSSLIRLHAPLQGMSVLTALAMVLLSTAVIAAAAGRERVVQVAILATLPISRARTGKMMMTMTPSSLTELVSRIADAARGDADAKKITLTRAIDRSDDIVVACDATRIEQIVWNLMSNAIKFTEPGGRVSVRLQRGCGEAVLEVTDSGRGIAAAFLPDVFAMFRQERRERPTAKAAWASASRSSRN